MLSGKSWVKGEVTSEDVKDIILELLDGEDGGVAGEGVDQRSGLRRERVDLMEFGNVGEGHEELAVAPRMEILSPSTRGKAGLVTGEIRISSGEFECGTQEGMCRKCLRWPPML